MPMLSVNSVELGTQFSVRKISIGSRLYSNFVVIILSFSNATSYEISKLNLKKMLGPQSMPMNPSKFSHGHWLCEFSFNNACFVATKRASLKKRVPIYQNRWKVNNQDKKQRDKLNVITIQPKQVDDNKKKAERIQISCYQMTCQNGFHIYL